MVSGRRSGRWPRRPRTRTPWPHRRSPPGAGGRAAAHRTASTAGGRRAPRADALSIRSTWRLVVDAAGAVARARLDLRRLAAVPQPVVERLGGDAQPRGDLLAGVHRTGADLLLRAAERQDRAGVDERGELVVVDQ